MMTLLYNHRARFAVTAQLRHPVRGEARHARLHAEGGAGLDGEPVVRELGEQRGRLVAPPVPDDGVERASIAPDAGRGHHQRAARRRHPHELGQGAVVVVDVLDDVERAHEIEARRRHRQGGDRPAHGGGLAVAQHRDGRGAEIDELRARDRQAKAQARRDLEPPRRGRAQALNQRPRVGSARPRPDARPATAIVETQIRFGDR